MVMTGALLDCERILRGFLAQPANALTSLAFLVVGSLVWRRRGEVWLGAALAATGVGSFLFHGPMPPGSQWAHDVSLGWLLAVVGASTTQWERMGGWPALALISVVLALAPSLADPLAGAVAVAAIGGILWRRRIRRTWIALGLLGLGAVVGRLSASEGPWCNPGTLLQGHAFWHLSAAFALWIWAWEPKDRDKEEPIVGVGV